MNIDDNVLKQHKLWLDGQGGCRADLRVADLREAILLGATLHMAYMTDTILGKIPSIKNIHQAVYQAASQPGALNMSEWHTCETTHCRAGWVVTLAGPGGAALEDAAGAEGAAELIYLASDPTLKSIPNFYANNEEALADMKRLAELEAGNG